MKRILLALVMFCSDSIASEISGGFSSGFIQENYVLNWNSENGVNYQIQQSTDLTNWNNVGSFLVGTGDSMSWANHITNSQSFYKVINADDLSPSAVTNNQAIDKVWSKHIGFNILPATNSAHVGHFFILLDFISESSSIKNLRIITDANTPADYEVSLQKIDRTYGFTETFIITNNYTSVTNNVVSSVYDEISGTYISYPRITAEWEFDNLDSNNQITNTQNFKYRFRLLNDDTTIVNSIKVSYITPNDN